MSSPRDILSWQHACLDEISWRNDIMLTRQDEIWRRNGISLVCNMSAQGSSDNNRSSLDCWLKLVWERIIGLYENASLANGLMSLLQLHTHSAINLLVVFVISIWDIMSSFPSFWQIRENRLRTHPQTDGDAKSSMVVISYKLKV